MAKLIILHGWQSSKEKWETVKDLLEEKGVDAFALDLPGFKPKNQPERAWGLDDYVKWLENVLGEGKEKVYLLGHSFGGRIAIKFAAKNPEKLKGLVLVAAAGIKKEKTLRDRILLKAIKLARKLGVSEGTSQTNGLCQICKKIFYRYVLKRTDYYKANPLQKEIMKKALEEDLKPLLSGIKTPTLIVWGEKDAFTPVKDGRLMNEMIKNSRIEVFPGYGHSLHLECPEKLVEKIIGFLK
ncbi:MAG: alpha/beta hydrolase [Candidatus Pacebacteria bacterium]|nr:alpha/beta hydrolase [Candidatus Paceibacterota bacterium]